jgi:hypothetical protein
MAYQNSVPLGPTRESDGEPGSVERLTPSSRRPGRLLKFVNPRPTGGYHGAYLRSLILFCAICAVCPCLRDPVVRI